MLRNTLLAVGVVALLACAVTSHAAVAEKVRLAHIGTECVVTTCMPTFVVQLLQNPWFAGYEHCLL